MQAKQIFLLILLPLWLLAGCSMPTAFTKPSKPQPTDPAALEASGDYEGAANLLTQMAATRKPPEQQSLHLRAAENLLRAQKLDAAQALLERTVTTGAAMADLDLHRRVLLAEIQIARSNPAGAMQQLPQRLPVAAPLELARRYYGARADSYRLSGKVLESVGELIELDAILTDQDQRLENQKAILQLLMPLAESTLELLQPKPPGVLGGWMELARLMKVNAGQPARLQSQLAQWRKRFPAHPALPNLIDSYYGRAAPAVQTGPRIAVLLPESGPLAKAGDALRDGMMAAWAQQPVESRPQLMFYDSGSFEQITPLYQQAVRDGAGTVVGPLNKEKVAQLLGAGNLPVPTLALNQVESSQPLPGNLVQFSLSPEDEALQVADGAWRDGLRVAVVLSPDNDWGARVYNGFALRWRELGGVIAEHQRYAPDGHDFATPIKALMNLDDSATRHQEMQRTLGKNLGFEPRARGDAQFIFMIAKAAQARQIRPQFQYQNTAGLPIYATSAIYSGDPNPQRDQDLNGVRFPEIPWLLHSDSQDPLSRTRMATALPESRGDYRRLYAMGMDAYTLAVALPRLGAQRGETIEGKTGLLYLGAQNQIERRMLWAQMENGTPQLLGQGETLPPGAASAAPPAEPLLPVR